jgi:uncharacterized protein YheU (UPF0270 family)
MSGDFEDEIDRSEAPTAVEVPLDELAPETLSALIESFVAREGTDYGAVERSFASKVADVRRQLERGEARIEFDPQTESVSIVRALPTPRTRE